MDLNLRKHEFNVFPLMNEEEMASLLVSMESVGYTGEPILLYEGEILDGWNRYQAAMQLNIDAPMEDFVGTRMEALLESIRRNQDRRHMNPGQMACVAVCNEELAKVVGVAVDEEKRQKLAEQERDENGVFVRSDKNLSERDEDTTRRKDHKIGEMFGVSRESIRMARYVYKWDIDLFIDVLNNTNGMKLFRAYQQVRDVRKMDQDAEESENMHAEYDKKQREEEVDRIEEEYDPRSVTIRDRKGTDPMDFDLDEEEEEDETDIAIRDETPKEYDENGDVVKHKPDINKIAIAISNKMVEMETKITELYEYRDVIAPESLIIIADCIVNLFKLINGEQEEDKDYDGQIE